jgi:hypothetical protein
MGMSKAKHTRLPGVKRRVEALLGQALTEAQWELIMEDVLRQAWLDGRVATQEFCDCWYVARYVFGQDESVVTQPAVQRFLADTASWGEAAPPERDGGEKGAQEGVSG